MLFHQVNIHHLLVFIIELFPKLRKPWIFHAESVLHVTTQFILDISHYNGFGFLFLILDE